MSYLTATLTARWFVLEKHVVEDDVLFTKWTRYIDNRADVIIEEPVTQEIERQLDSDSYKSADSGSDGEDGCVGTHSPPLAQRKSARQRKLPAKYDGFIIGPLKQLSVILENKFLGQVYTEHYTQMCV